MAKKNKKAAKQDTPSPRRVTESVTRVHEGTPGDKLDN